MGGGGGGQDGATGNGGNGGPGLPALVDMSGPSVSHCERPNPKVSFEAAIKTAPCDVIFGSIVVLYDPLARPGAH